MQQPQQRRMSMSPRRFIEREQNSKSNNNTKITTNGVSPMNNYYEQQIKKNNHNQQQTMNDQYTGNFFDMDSSIDQKLKYIRGSPLNIVDLKRALAHKATCCLIMSP